jgi:hypothetical protein
MADTGVNWPLSWTQEYSGTLTTAGTVTDTSAALDLDIHSSIEISIDADYSDHAKATGGLRVYILRDVNGTDYEVDPVADSNSVPWGFEMPFSQNATVRKTFTLRGVDVSRFKIFLHWANTTASSNVTVVTNYQTSSIPVAS